MNKILVTIQGRTLILHYQIKPALVSANSKFPAYIEVFPSDELLRFDLKGLTPEMFCVNIADMVNNKGLFQGQVENERQIPVARWSMNQEEYLEAINQPLTQQEVIEILKSMPDYVQESNNQFIDFAQIIVKHSNAEEPSFSGYRLTIMIENIDGEIISTAHYNLDTRITETWQGKLPAQSDFDQIHVAIDKKLQVIRDAGIKISRIYDETDYSVSE